MKNKIGLIGLGLVLELCGMNGLSREVLVKAGSAVRLLGSKDQHRGTGSGNISWQVHNRQIFRMNGLEYLKQPKVATSLVKKENIKKCWVYLHHREQLEELALRYGDSISQSQVVPQRIQFINDQVGHGSFALVDVAPGQMVGEYTGNICEQDGTIGKYAWNYSPIDSYPEILLDATRAGNEMRFINHDSRPNLAIERIVFGGIWRLIYVAKAPIKAGTQLLTNYGAYYCDWNRLGGPVSFVREDGTHRVVLEGDKLRNT